MRINFLQYPSHLHYLPLVGLPSNFALSWQHVFAFYAKWYILAYGSQEQESLRTLFA